MGGVDGLGDGGKGRGMSQLLFHAFFFVPKFMSGESYPELCAQRAEDLLFCSGAARPLGSFHL